MKCSVCGRVSANGDHADCAEMRRMGLEDENQKRTATEKIGMDGAGLGTELRVLLDRMGVRRDD